TSCDRGGVAIAPVPWHGSERLGRPFRLRPQLDAGSGPAASALSDPPRGTRATVSISPRGAEHSPRPGARVLGGRRAKDRGIAPRSRFRPIHLPPDRGDDRPASERRLGRAGRGARFAAADRLACARRLWAARAGPAFRSGSVDAP